MSKELYRYKLKKGNDVWDFVSESVPENAENAVSAADRRILVARIGTDQHTGGQVKDPHPDRDKHTGPVSPGDVSVDISKYLSRCTALASPVIDHDFG